MSEGIQQFVDENASYENGFYVVRNGSSLLVAIPRDENVPDGGRKASVVGKLVNGEFTINSINVNADQQGHGLGSKLLRYLQELPEINSITANPSLEALQKEFYPKNGFSLEKKVYQWSREVARA